MQLLQIKINKETKKSELKTKSQNSRARAGRFSELTRGAHLLQRGSSTV